MKCIPPFPVTDAMFVSSTVAEPAAGETLWAAGTNWALGAIVARTTTHRLYLNLIAGIDATLPENAPTRWADAGPTLKWAMFDTLRNSATTAANSMTIVLAPGRRIDSLALMGLVGESVTVTGTVASVPVYTFTSNLILRNTTSWSSYFFGEFSYQGNVVRFDVPPFTGMTLTITISRASGQVACGAMVVGKSVFLGKSLNQVASDADNFSTVTRDQFGNAALVPRRTIPKTDQKLIAEAALVNSIRELRTKLNAAPAVWSGLDDASQHPLFDAVLILGIYKTFSISLKLPLAEVALTLEEI